MCADDRIATARASDRYIVMNSLLRSTHPTRSDEPIVIDRPSRRKTFVHETAVPIWDGHLDACRHAAPDSVDCEISPLIVPGQTSCGRHHTMRSFTRRCALGAVVCSLLPASAAAQDFPTRPITLMVGLAAGGITDVTARFYAEAVSRLTGERAIVENRAGAGGSLAAAQVQSAAPDGYTLLVFSGSQHATVPASGNASYDPVKGFAPVTFLFNSVVALTVPAGSPAQSMKELQELGRRKPGGLTFGT